jgi:Flp pilus assembly protein TadG
MQKAEAHFNNCPGRRRMAAIGALSPFRSRRSVAARLLTDQNGQVLPWVALAMLVVLTSSALAVDVAHVLVVQRQMQSATDAAALAAAARLPATDYSTVGQAYSAAGNNSYNGVTVNTPTITPLCLQTVKNWGIFCASSGGTVTVANAIRVTQTGSISTYFAGAFGVRNIPFSVTSTASKGKPKSYNIAVIVDSTLSMGESDSNCVINGSTVTQMQCALTGVQQLLTNLNTNFDRVALFTFPNIATGSSAGVVSGWTPGTDDSGTYQCTTPISGRSYNYSSLYGYYSMLYSSGNDSPYSGAAIAMPYTFPPIPNNTQGYSAPTGTYAPTYEVVGFSNNYNTTNSDGTVSLNTGANLVKAVGGNSNCGGIEPSNYDGNYGTYYAGALYAAQAALLAEQTRYDQSGNVIIVLGDGNSTAPNDTSSPYNSTPAMPSSSGEATTTYRSSSSLNTSAYTFPGTYGTAGSSGTYPSYVGECGQAVDAAQYAATYPGNSSNATRVYSIAYGAPVTSSSSNCKSDRSGGTHRYITPCQTLQQMTSGSNSSYTSEYFYSDWAAQGGSQTSGCQASSATSGITAIADIYRAIAATLTGTRLVPNTMQ